VVNCAGNQLGFFLGNEPLAYTSNEGMSVAINQRVATAEADNSSRSHL